MPKRLVFYVLASLIAATAFAQGPTINGCPVFPANNIWNTPIDTLPVHPHSSDYITSIGPNSGFRYDMTFPLNIVPGTQPLVPILIDNPDESDPGPFPIPPNAGVENGSDQHVLVIDKDNCILYEMYLASLQPDGSWEASSTAKWSLLSNALRPAGWTSADAAGLPIMPGLLRYDEVLAGQINHALRFTVPKTQRLYVWPGRHYASSNTSVLLPPMGQRFRLKASFDISTYSPQMQVILTALKKYGLFVADNGLPWFLQGATDSRWNTNDLDTLRKVVGSNMEAVDESGLIVDPNSGQATGSGTVTVFPPTVTLNESQPQQFTATVTGSTAPVTWSYSPQLGTLSSTGLYTAPATITSVQPVTITATSGTLLSGSATVTLNPPPAAALSSIGISPSTIVGGNNISLTVFLTAPAPAAGATVTIQGSNSAFPQASVTVGSGVSFQTFSLPTAVVTATTPVTLTATYNGVKATGLLTVDPAAPPLAMTSESLTPAGTIIGGQPLTVNISLNQPAPANGAAIAFTSTIPAIAPATLTVPAGASSATFTLPTLTAEQVYSGTLSLTLNGASKSFGYALYPVLVITPSAPSLKPRQRQSFKAAVPTPLPIVWSMSPQIGTLGSNGLYIAPASISQIQTVIITATSGTQSASATVTLHP